MCTHVHVQRCAQACTHVHTRAQVCVLSQPVCTVVHKSAYLCTLVHKCAHFYTTCFSLGEMHISHFSGRTASGCLSQVGGGHPLVAPCDRGSPLLLAMRSPRGSRKGVCHWGPWRRPPTHLNPLPGGHCWGSVVGKGFGCGGAGSVAKARDPWPFSCDGGGIVIFPATMPLGAHPGGPRGPRLLET